MPPIDSIDLAYGIPLIVVIPAVIQIAKHNGLPTRLAAPAAILTATVLIALGDVAVAPSDDAFGQRLRLADRRYCLRACRRRLLQPDASTGR